MIIRLGKTPLLSGSLGSRSDIVASTDMLSLQPVQSIGQAADQPQLFVDADPSTGIWVWELNDSNTLTTPATVATSFAEFTDGAPQVGDPAGFTSSGVVVKAGVAAYAPTGGAVLRGR